MKHKIYIIYILIALFFHTGCKNSGYLDEGQKSIISLLCNTTWTRSEKNANETINESYTFNTDGSYVKEFMIVDDKGDERKQSYRYAWAFGDQGSNTIYFSNNGSSPYWRIKDLTAEKLCIYEISGQVGTPNYQSKYLEFKAKEHSR